MYEVLRQSERKCSLLSVINPISALGSKCEAALDLTRGFSNSFAPTNQGYRRAGNLRAVQLLLGHTRIESTIRYLGIEVDDALAIAEQVDV